MQTRFVAEKIIEAPAPVVYHLISDYAEHHREPPQGFLPDAFSDMVVERGGVGEGSVVRWTSSLGGRRQTMTASISEPEPGRVMVERGDGVVTTFTVEPAGDRRARVRFDTVLEAGGLQGLMIRLFAPGMLRPVYAQELARLEQHAQAHPALVPA
ncbi:MAG TPA: SRPBCC family protein [Chloroflexota bacterium]|nr:SRPBCC family protein [Chloroflexota bacterium]